MLLNLIKKEISLRLLDRRFAIVVVLIAVLSFIATVTGVENYRVQLKEYSETEEFRRTSLENWIERGQVDAVAASGYTWNRPPEVLLPFVNGLSGSLPREGTMREQTSAQHRPPVHFETSTLEMNPGYRLFGTLDLALIVEIVLSISAFVLTFDSVCGEKEGGTLRLQASFSVPRAMLAIAKLAAISLTVWVPFTLAFILACLVAALAPDLALTRSDWILIAGLFVLFQLYLSVYVAFGLFVSALVYRSSSAFLILLGLWALWVYLIPNVAVRSAIAAKPTGSIFEIERQSNRSRWEITGRLRDELGNGWDSMGERSKRGKDEYYAFMDQKMNEWENHVRARNSALEKLAFLSPLLSVHLTAMDLAGTGLRRQVEITGAFRNFRTYFVAYIWENQGRRHWDSNTAAWAGEDGGPFQMTEFARFSIQDQETAGERIARNAIGFLMQALLTVVGFAAAFVAILRYDVR